MKKSIEDKKTHLSQTRTALKSKMTRLCNTLELSHTENQCVNECWMILFDHYFDILGVSRLYKVEIIACYREIVDPNSQAKPREKRIHSANKPSNTRSRSKEVSHRMHATVLSLCIHSFIFHVNQQRGSRESFERKIF